MPKVLHFSDRIGQAITLRLDSHETCLISAAQPGVLVRKTQCVWFGSTLYDVTDAILAARTVVALYRLFPRNTVPVEIESPVLAAFANAAWHCATARALQQTLHRAVFMSGQDS